MIPHTPDNEWHSDDNDHWHICTVCKAVIDETKTAHTPDNEWHTDGTNHWHVGADCQKELGKTAHTPDNEWHSDETGHWHVCTECDEVLGKTAHNPGPDATEENPQTCTECNYVIAQALGHQCKNHLDKVERKEPTCTATGNIEYWECSEDHKKYRDANAEQFVADDAVILQMIPHTPDNEWHSDETGHWHVCTVCNSVVDKHEHNPGPAATEEASQTCTECGYELAPKLEPKYKLGDIDGDGDIDANDYMMLKRHVLRTFKLSDEQKLRADINGDGNINATDYMLLKRAVLGTYKIA